MAQPLVSVIIPVYNTGASAARLAQKLLQDNYTNLEVIIIDDGSTDDSYQLIHKVSKSQRLQVLQQTNQGRSAARNAGLAHAKGDYIVFIDSDDDIKPQLITKLVQQISQPDVALVMPGQKYHRVSSDTTETLYTTPTIKPKKHDTRASYILRVLLQDGRLYGVIGKIFHANIIRQHHLQFDRSMRYAEDTKFVLAYLKYSSGDIITVPEPLYLYEYGTATSQSTTDAADWHQWQKSYQNLRRWAGRRPTHRERILLHRIYWHWRGAWFKAKLRSHQ